MGERETKKGLSRGEKLGRKRFSRGHEENHIIVRGEMTYALSIVLLGRGDEKLNIFYEVVSGRKKEKGLGSTEGRGTFCKHMKTTPAKEQSGRGGKSPGPRSRRLNNRSIFQEKSPRNPTPPLKRKRMKVPQKG